MPDVVCVFHQVFKCVKKMSCPLNYLQVFINLQTNIIINKDHKMSLLENNSEQILRKVINEGTFGYLLVYAVFLLYNNFKVQILFSTESNASQGLSYQSINAPAL